MILDKLCNQNGDLEGKYWSKYGRNHVWSWSRELNELDVHEIRFCPPPYPTP